MPTEDSFAELLDLLERADLDYLVIGGHAVNTWLEPRFTADIDVTIQAGQTEIERLEQLLVAHEYRVTREHGARLPSDPVHPAPGVHHQAADSAAVAAERRVRWIR